MITRLQTIFLKHNKVLLGALLIVVIGAFVLTIGPQSFFGGSDTRNIEAQNFFGYNINSERTMRSLMAEAQVSSTFHPELGLRGEALQEYAFMRAAGLGLARSLGVPKPDKQTVETYVRSLPVFQDRESGNFSSEQYQQYMDMLKFQAAFSEELMSRVLRDDAQIAQVRALMAGPSYVQPFEARENLKARDTAWTIKLAKASYDDFQPELDPSVEELRAFYDQNPERYAVPERLQVSAVQFPAQNYLDEAGEPTDAQLNENFTRNKFRYQQMFNQRREAEKAQQAADGEAPAEAEETPEVQLDDVREAVVQDWKMNRAREIAGTNAEAFTVRLWREQIERGSEAFQKAVQELDASVQTVPAYSRGNPPQSPLLPQQALESMWIYTAGQRYFSDPTPHRAGAVVLIANEVLPAEQPAFEEVYDQVDETWKSQERRRAFVEQGREWSAQLTDAVAQGRAFEDAAEELGLAAEELDSFTGGEVPQALRRGELWGQMQYLSEGDVSPMLVSGSEGTIAYVVWKEEPEVSSDSPELAEYVANQREFLDNMSGWIRLREFANSALAKVRTAATQVE